MDRYDSIIVGAGHNGLVCAAYLARGGHKILVLEASDKAGGLAASRDFHPGYTASVAHSISHFSEQIIHDLALESHGFVSSAAQLSLIGLSDSQQPVVIHKADVSGVGDDDAGAYVDYLRLLRKCAKTLEPFWSKTMPRIGPGSLRDMLTFAHVGMKLRGMGKADMREFMRIASLPARDLMDEFFSSDLLKATLSWDALIGSKMAPRSPNSSVLTLLYRMAGNAGGAHSVLTSGLVGALSKSAEASGVDIRLSSAVDRVNVVADGNGPAIGGVTLANGEQIAADTVVSATDPKRTFLELVGVEHLDIGFTNRIRRLRCDGYVGKLHLALDALPVFTGVDNPNCRMIIAPNVDAIEFAYDDSKYGKCSDEPVMEIVIPSLADPSLAPSGGHVLSAHVMYIPRQLAGGWTDTARNEVCERSIDSIARYAPDIRNHIVHSEFLTPLDLEREYRVTGGHWHHTEFAMDQLLMMRPTYDAAQYRTPISGLFLCGAGCHPGGDLTGAAGRNAAREILR